MNYDKDFKEINVDDVTIRLERINKAIEKIEKHTKDGPIKLGVTLGVGIALILLLILFIAGAAIWGINNMSKMITNPLFLGLLGAYLVVSLSLGIWLGIDSEKSEWAKNKVSLDFLTDGYKRVHKIEKERFYFYRSGYSYWIVFITDHGSEYSIPVRCKNDISDNEIKVDCVDYTAYINKGTFEKIDAKNFSM